MNMNVAAIVIGRNEGPRLSECLRSVLKATPHVIYVDSGSSDNSPTLAESLGVHVIRLAAPPFTAARGRQEGLQELQRLYPETPYVQFIDGDCILDPKWLPAALACIESDSRIAGVCGRRREERTAKSFFSRLIDIDWDIPPGEVRYFGGDSLARIAAINDAGGWPIDLIAGEEPDLCFRMGDKGWRIVRLPIDQTRHDVAMTRFRQYWRRAIRSGHAYAEVAMRRYRSSGKPWLRQTISILLYGFVFPIGILLTLLMPLALLLIAETLFFLLYLRLAISIVRYCRGRNRPWSLAVAYALVEIPCKLAAALGVLRFLIGRLSRRRSALIEYKADHATATEVTGKE